jgi:hypothetical protein
MRTEGGGVRKGACDPVVLTVPLDHCCRLVLLRTGLPMGSCDRGHPVCRLFIGWGPLRTSTHVGHCCVPPRPGRILPRMSILHWLGVVHGVGLV